MKNIIDIQRIFQKLQLQHDNSYTETINYESLFTLLIGVMLSAQSTDKQVNTVTSILFKKYKKPHDFASLSQKELENYIKSVGLYRTKAKNIIATSKKIIHEFNNTVPSNRKDLMSLPGVGRKTANVILSVYFGKPEMAVDTHVGRVAYRIGISQSKKPYTIEKDIVSLIEDKKKILMYHMLFIKHGRTICRARKPMCISCNIKNMCQYYLCKKNI